MANIKKNFDVFPENTYVGANLGFITAGNNILGSIQFKHPNEGIAEFAVSNDFDTKEMVDKLWTPISVRLQGTTVFIPSIDFSLVAPDPVMVKFGCFSFAFLKVTLTTAGGIFRAIYNVPTGSTD
jgi:hypothetical protein